MTHTNIFSLAMGSLTTVNGLTPLPSTSPSRGNPTLLREIPLAEHSLHKTLTDFKLPLIEGLPTYNACKDCATADSAEETVMVQRRIIIHCSCLHLQKSRHLSCH